MMAIERSIDWNNPWLDMLKPMIVSAANENELVQPLTEWFVNQEWKKDMRQLASRVEVPARTSNFVARDEFPDDLFDRDEHFDSWFILGGGKIEHPSGIQPLKVIKLMKTMRPSQLIGQLGGEAKIETSLASMHCVMTTCKDEATRFFFVRDRAGGLRVIMAFMVFIGEERLCELHTTSLHDETPIKGDCLIYLPEIQEAPSAVAA
ncbi:MAG: hypothetical protein JWO00_543 [Candidatus Parcubacteria bacterium]|nr:hypothetical protein [Candidatus Parcubacteria bacterium]